MKFRKTIWRALAVFLCVLPIVTYADDGISADSGESDYYGENEDSGPRFFSSAPKERYLELALLNGRSGFFSPSRPPSILETIRVIKKAGADKNIRGIILNTSGFYAEKNVLWELRSALETFKASGKKVIAFFDNADYDLYALVSVADRIIMDEEGLLTFSGYVYGRGYYREALDKLGIGVRELRYLNYKTAMEGFTRSALSDADRKQYGAYLDDIFYFTKNVIKQARSWDEQQFNTILNREFIYSAGDAKERGLVDGIGRSDEVIRAAEELEGGWIEDYRLYGDSLASLTPWSTSYRAGKPFGFTKEIAVVYATGETDLDRAMGTRNLAVTIRELAAKKRVKAIVVRIDSPGGSAEAADYLAEAVRDARNSVPVVISMGSVAASGGYWASMNASRIVASPYTLTGSIGVIAGWFYDTGLYGKLGLTLDLLSRGAHADLTAGILLPHRDMTGDEEAQFRRYILELYADFVARVAAGRNMSTGAVEAVAQGRVYSGLMAKEVGLVDQIGGIGDSLRLARELAEIPPGKQVIYSEYPKPRFIDRLAARYGLPSPPVNASLLTAAFNAGTAIALEDLRYRLSRNGEAMPILPLGLLP